MIIFDVAPTPWISPTHRCNRLHAYPCGYYGDPLKPCTCSSSTVTSYQKRIFDLGLDLSGRFVEEVVAKVLIIHAGGFDMDIDAVQERSGDAQELQRQQFQLDENSSGTPNPQVTSCNSDMHPPEIYTYSSLDDDQRQPGSYQTRGNYSGDDSNKPLFRITLKLRYCCLPAYIFTQIKPVCE